MGKPKIRFQGYTEDWEQRKLGDEAIEMLAGGDIDKSRVVENGKYPIYANALTNDGIVGYYDDYYRVKAPAVTVTGRGDVGHAQARTVDFTPVVRLLAIRSEHDAYFLENAINNHGVIVESTGVPQLTVPQLGNYMIQFPRTIEEETKIGDYFRNLDHLITLHQRKCDETKKLKKYMLQKMFSQNGHSVPEIRFSGFTEDWEQRKLGLLGEIMTGSTPSTSKPEYYSEDGIPWVTPTDINALTISDTPKKLSEEGMKVGRVVPANTILCTCIASIGKNALLTVRGSFNQQINSLTPSAENDSYFLLTESELWSEKMKRMAASGTMQIVNKTEFSELVTMVPSLNEQKIIGSYFHNLDHLITLHQYKPYLTKRTIKKLLTNIKAQKGEELWQN